MPWDSLQETALCGGYGVDWNDKLQIPGHIKEKSSLRKKEMNQDPLERVYYTGTETLSQELKSQNIYLTLTSLTQAFILRWFIKKCAVSQLINIHNGVIIVIHYIECYNTTVRKTLKMHHVRYKIPPSSHSLFVAKSGGNVLPI